MSYDRLFLIRSTLPVCGYNGLGVTVNCNGTAMITTYSGVTMSTEQYIRMMQTKCTCLTKTNIYQYHKAECEYRKVHEIILEENRCHHLSQ